jgi:hypothetical protein
MIHVLQAKVFALAFVGKGQMTLEVMPLDFADLDYHADFSLLLELLSQSLDVSFSHIQIVQSHTAQ